MPTVLLIRHGENDYVKKQRLAGRLPGVHLNERGRAQAQALARALKDTPLKAIYCSPLERAVETAQPIAAARGLKVIKRDALVETRLGEWEGQSVRRLSRSKQWKLLQEHPSRFRFPGGEWMVEQQARLAAEIEALCAMHKPKDIIACVGHADPLKLIIAYYIGLPLDNFQRLMVNTASISTLVMSARGALLLNLNQSPAEFNSKHL
jgi:probable phosphoglycerate mutase